jgi:hypothetical protein
MFDCSITREGLDIEVTVITVAVGGGMGVVISWLSVGSMLISPILLTSLLGMRSIHQQILNLKDFVQFEKMLVDILEDEEVTKTVRITYVEHESLTPASQKLTMQPIEFDQESVIKYDFSVKSDKDLEDFIKNTMRDPLGLIENPSDQQLQEILKRKVTRRYRERPLISQIF